MAGYIGPAPVPQATQTREVFTLSSTQTTVGTGGYTPGFVDVYLNGAKLAPADFTATNGSDIVLASGGAANDILEVVAFQEFTVVDQTFSGDITFTGANYNLVWDASDNALEFADNAKAVFGTGSDLTIYHDGSRSIIQDNGTGNLRIQANNLELNNADNSENYIFAAADGAVTLYHNNSERVATTSYGTEVTASDAGVAKVRLRRTDVSNSDVDLRTGDGSNGKDFTIHVNQSERFRIDDTGDIILGGTSTADETNKSFNLQMRSHDTNEENFNVIQLEAESTFNQISIGGGTSALNCATAIRFLTGNIDTTTGTEAMRIDSSGNVGIGTSSPSAKFHVDSGSTDTVALFESSGDANAYLVVKDSGSSGGAFFGANGTSTIIGTGGSTTRMTIDSSGRVGIGLTNPGDYYGNQLVVNTPNEGGITMVGPTSGEHYLMWADGTSGGERYRGYIGYSHTNNYMRFATGASERMRIDSNGHINVGLPGGNSTAIIQGTSGSGSTNQPGTDLQLKGGAGGGTGGSNIKFYTAPGGSSGTSESAAVEVVRINSDGDLLPFNNLAIGLTSGLPNDAQLTIGNGTPALFFHDTTGGQNNAAISVENGAMKFANGNTGSNVSDQNLRMTLTSDGALQIGNTNSNPTGNHVPEVMLQGAGGSMFHRDDGVAIKVGRNDANECMEFFKQGASQGGISLTSSGVTYNSDSDYRLKENVTYTWDATTRLQQLKPAQFNFISVPDETMNGFLAHEVEAIVPDAVSGAKDAVDDDGNIKAQRIDHSRLVPLLVKALQELSAKNDSLEARIATLEAGS